MKILYIAPEDVLNDIAMLNYAMLSGSRSMASRPATENFDPMVAIGSKITKDTDWDFAAPYNEKNHNTLIKLGFEYYAPETLDYKDDLTTGIYEKLYHNVKVQVSLRSNYYVYDKTWNSISPEFYYDYIWKRGPNYSFCSKTDTKTTIRNILNQLFKSVGDMM